MIRGVGRACKKRKFYFPKEGALRASFIAMYRRLRTLWHGLREKPQDNLLRHLQRMEGELFDQEGGSPSFTWEAHDYLQRGGSYFFFYFERPPLKFFVEGVAY